MGPKKETVLHILHLFLLANFAVAQPLFNLLSQQAEFFVARGSEPIDIIILVFILSILLPITLIFVERITTFINPYLGKWVHGVLFIFLVTMIALPALKGLSSGNLPIVTGIFIGCLVLMAYRYFRPIRIFFTALTPTPIIFVGLFLLNPQIHQLVFPSDISHEIGVKVKNPAPVIILVFDELPTLSLLNDKIEINPVTFPNFASFAKNATWFPNATTVADYTPFAIPAILTGNYPGLEKKNPTAKEHPHNLFTLLGGVYDLKVIESMTHLCPKKLCLERPILEPLRKRLPDLVSDLAIFYLHILLPEKFSLQLPVITRTWKNFGHLTQSLPPKKIEFDQKDNIWEDWSSIFSKFNDSIHPTPKPTFYFIHALLPHLPWRYLPSGETYQNSGIGFNLITAIKKDRWLNDEWLVAQGFQRHILQLGFADKLLGDVINRLKAIGLYDPALIIITADHGASFFPNEYFRKPVPSNFHEIMLVPLLIKVPYQNAGKILDRNVETIDILPTVSDILGVSLPWPVDGQSVFGSAQRQFRKKVIFSSNKERKPIRLAYDATLNGAYPILKKHLSWFYRGENSNWVYKLGPFGKIIDHSLNEFETGKKIDVRIEVDRAVFSHSHITGRVFKGRGSREGRFVLAIELDGQIRAVTRTYYLDKETEMFSAFIPEKVPIGNQNNIGFFIVSETEGLLKLHPTTFNLMPTYSLSSRKGGKGVTILTSDGQTIPVLRNSIRGKVSYVAHKGGRIIISGWAADSKNNQLPDSIVIFVNGKSVFSGYSNRDVVNPMSEATRKAGFQFDIPEKLFFNGTRIQIFAISKTNSASQLGWTQDAIKGLTEGK